MADTLPFHILVGIFVAVRDQTPPSRGGAVVSWASAERIRHLPLVCSAWLDAARFVIYRSVALFGGTSAARFTRTLEDFPQRAHIVRSLLISDDDTANGGRDAEEHGQQLIKALSMCPNVDTLQIRPLPTSVRVPLLAAIAAKRLKVLVCVPRLNTPESAMFHLEDIPMLSQPSLEVLEMDFWTSPESRIVLPTFQPLAALTHLAMNCSGAHSFVLPLIFATKSLKVLDIYIEAMYDDPAEVARSFVPTQATLQRCTFITNPSLANLPGHLPPFPPSFDRILAHSHQREHLTLGATDISVAALRCLPGSLHTLEIESITDFPHFEFSDTLIDTLLDPSIPFTLRTLVIRDDFWTPQEVERTRTACAGRGIEFVSDWQ